MREKIFRSILNVTIVVLISGLLLFTIVLTHYYSGIQRKQLKDKLSLAALGVEQQGLHYLSQMGEDEDRITWIAKDGSILFDNHADIDKMGNHSDREEVKEAMETGVGSSRRHSITLTRNTVYEAVLLSDQTVLRISMDQISTLALLWGLIQPFGIILLLVVAIVYYVAEKLADQIMQPLDLIDLEHPLEEESYEEMAPFLNQIYHQKKQIKKQGKELDLRKLEFEQVVSHMREGLVLLNTNNQVLSINPAAMEIFQTTEKCIGADILSVERKQKFISAIEKAKEQGHSEIRLEKNNREYQFDISSICTKKGNGGFIILAFDITEQRNAEKMRREFSANVSHELKTPLQSIIGSAELMKTGIVKEEDIPRFIGHIHTEASRLVVLIEDIIRLSELDEEGEIQKEEVSLHQVATEVLLSLREKAEKQKVTLQLKGSQGIIPGVYRLLHEVIYNLCENAIKYNIEGGKVVVKIEDREQQASISVEDTGIGIPLEHQERVFERFYRVDKSHSKKTGGTGLGLSIVKHAVGYHNGKIDLFSREGKGTTVMIWFPKN
ncbi:MAG: ATP-binding protein [Lachnospiraceae bacterium]|nr:ATP-binding protein [Lachnospiraceae bacterium]